MEIPLAGEPSDAARARTRAPSSGRLWYYEDAGMQHGPVEEAVLRQLLLTGQVDHEALVWNDGLANWTPASQIPGMISLVSTAGHSGRGHSSASDADVQSLCKAASASQPWVIFLAITAFIYAGLTIVAGFLTLMLGARIGSPPWVAWGLFTIIGGIVHAVGGILLSGYANRLARLRYRSDCEDLEISMLKLKTFWMFASIVLIVVLAFIGFLTI